MNQVDKILLVGDIEKAFLDKTIIERPYCDNVETISEAIEVLRNNSYSAIAIVIFGFEA